MNVRTLRFLHILISTFTLTIFAQGISEMEMNKLLRHEVSSHPSMYEIGHFAQKITSSDEIALTTRCISLRAIP